MKVAGRPTQAKACGYSRLRLSLYKSGIAQLMNTWTMARGYRFAGIHCGLRPDPERRDLALVVSDSPAAAAGVFTQNRVVAAPVQVTRERLPAGDVRGVVICSGNANACTGQRGLEDA